MPRSLILGALSLLITCSLAWAEEQYSDGGASQCLGCHDFGDESPVHAMLSSPHGQADNPDTPMAQRGCENCHGPSAPHTRAPTQTSPGVSYGPRWSASVEQQNGSCMACHEANVAKHWSDSPHGEQDLSCITCHDIHTQQDKVLSETSQGQVCTVCHKAQKSGMHGLDTPTADNPACTNCHNPHQHESPVTAMIENRSEGCRNCHDLVAMSTSKTGSSKARSYHKVMAQTDRTCLDCHVDIAHADTRSSTPLIPRASRAGDVTLFYPGQSHSEWLLSDHPGSQPLRQGRNCQQCHRGEEANMAHALEKTMTGPGLRQVRLEFGRDESHLLLSASWEGPADDADFSLMWGDSGNEAFTRGGCFAACHADMTGMDRDRGQRQSKYLMASRSQQQRIGKPAITRSAEELKTLMEQGNFVEIWQVQLQDGEAVARTASLLSSLHWDQSSALSATASHSDGRWTLRLRRPLAATAGHKSFLAGSHYTFGLALHGRGNPGGQHWVSLPISFTLAGDDSDFRAQ